MTIEIARELTPRCYQVAQRLPSKLPLVGFRSNPWPLAFKKCNRGHVGLCIIAPQLLTSGMNRAPESPLKVLIAAVRGQTCNPIVPPPHTHTHSLRNSPNLLGTLNQDNPEFVASTLERIPRLATF